MREIAREFWATAAEKGTGSWVAGARDREGILGYRGGKRDRLPEKGTGSWVAGARDREGILGYRGGKRDRLLGRRCARSRGNLELARRKKGQAPGSQVREIAREFGAGAAAKGQAPGSQVREIAREFGAGAAEKGTGSWVAGARDREGILGYRGGNVVGCGERFERGARYAGSVRAINVRCPNCGASLTVDDGASSVACQYCGTSARIQTRSRVFQVPRALPLAQGPIARQPFNRAVLIGPILFLVIAAAVGVSVVVRAPRRASPAAAPQAPQPGQSVSVEAPPPKIYPDTWATGFPLITDVDGDGGDDMIGLTRNVHDGDRGQIGAFSGDTGAPLWRGDPIGTYSESVQNTLYLAGDLILMATPAGELRAFARADGAPRWTAALGERINVACVIGDQVAAAVVGTNDRRWHTVALVDGEQADAAAPRRVEPRDRTRTSLAWVEGKLPAGTCVPLPSNDRNAMPGLATADSWSKLPKIEGMSVVRLVRRGEGPIVAVGRKWPGTGVPMLAVLDGRTARWTTVVPDANPLEARADDHHVTVGADAVFQVWEGKDGPHLTAFDLADGRRRWDVALDKDQARVVIGAVIVGARVVVAGWGGLQAFGVTDGAFAYTLGG
ncbi:MAG: PQQ-binding-like beta-propeller repeat protein [Myxococcales bacterium]|nr:PQQ-binding-like beta-propeller repeat protein [Myxococcales bacterium]